LFLLFGQQSKAVKNLANMGPPNKGHQGSKKLLVNWFTEINSCRRLFLDLDKFSTMQISFLHPNLFCEKVCRNYHHQLGVYRCPAKNRTEVRTIPVLRDQLYHHQLLTDKSQLGI